MRSSSSDVLIVGAGPAGLALAIGLRLHGVSVRVVEREAAAKRQPRAAVVWPGESDILDALEVLPAFQAQAVSLQSAEVRAYGRRLGVLRLEAGEGPQRTPLVIEQHATERLLSGRLETLGGAVDWSTELQEFEEDGERVRVRLAGPLGEERHEAAWIVGADGAGSRVREIAGIAFPGKPRRNLECVQINAWPQWRHGLPRSTGWYFLKPDASLGVFPLPEGGCRFFCFKTDDAPERTDPPTVAEMRDLVARTADAPETELHPTEPHWLNRARFTDRVADTLAKGRVLLVGDAAHAWAAVGGHGMNVALQDAFGLAWRIAAVHRDLASPDLLKSYSDEQRERAFEMIRAIRFDVIERPPHPLLLPPLALGLTAALALPALQTRLMRTIGDVELRHGPSPLNTGPDAGRRVAAASWARPGWRLEAGAALADGFSAAADRFVLTSRLSGSEGDRVRFVRPDGYVAWSGGARDLSDFECWLGRWFAPR